MNLLPRDRRAILLGAGVLVLVLVVYWLADWGEARAHIPAGRTNLEKLESAMRRLLRQREHVAAAYGPAAGRPLEGIETAKITLLKAVQDALRGGIQDPNYQPQPARAAQELPGVQLVPLRVTGKCRLPQLTKCLSDLRQADTLVFVDQIDLSGNEKQPGQLEVTLILATLARQEGMK
jgi:type II secretory pathway component PulM